MTAMQHIVNQMIRDVGQERQNSAISRQQYEQWARGFVFDGLRSQRYGQSFCNHFGITDNILYFSSTVEEADRYIQKNYVK